MKYKVDPLQCMGQGSIATVMGKVETKKQKNRLNIISTEQLDKYL
jgi:hypothetical protein